MMIIWMAFRISIAGLVGTDWLATEHMVAVVVGVSKRIVVTWVVVADGDTVK